MIIGIGSDIVNIKRIEKILDKFGEKFEKRLFTPAEQAKAHQRPRQLATSYAKRFAAKEACTKALGTGFQQGVYWQDIEILNLPSGKPYINLKNGAKKLLDSLTPANQQPIIHLSQPIIHLSMSDDYPFAQAMVVISKEYTAEKIPQKN